MKSILKIFLIFVITTLFISGAMAACNIDISNFTVELRSDQDGYANTIYAENNSEIDIKINFDIDYIGDQADCATSIGANAEIFRWNDSTSDWVRIRTTTTKSQDLEEDSFTFSWGNEFSVDDLYDRYKVEGVIRNGTTELDRKESYIDIENNTCTGIVLQVSDFEIDEGRSEREYFYVENNTNKNFEINNAEIYFTSSGVTSGSVDYPSRVNSRSTGSMSVNLSAANVSRDTTVTGRFRVSGYLDGTYCSVNNIGEETFDVRIIDTGTGSSGGTTSSSGVCADLQLITNDFEMNESSTAQEIFYLKNNSTKRFEILEVKVIDSGLDVETYYLEKYAFPNNLANIVIKTTAGNVTQNRIYENTLQVRGRYSDGVTCSFTNIGERSFSTTVLNTNLSSVQTCEGFTINVADNIELKNAGTIPITITNGTSRTANVYIESQLQVIPALISLPANSSITRELSVNVINRDGTITIKPEIFGCPTEQTKVITVRNTASGELSTIAVTNRVENDQNGIKLITAFDNPTDKFFTGIVSFSGNGWSSEDKLVTLAPGQNFVETIITPSGQNQASTGKISFSSNGQTIEKDITITGGPNALSGLFAFGANLGGVGLLLIIIIAAVLIVVYITNNSNTQTEKEINEPWQTN